MCPLVPTYTELSAAGSVAWHRQVGEVDAGLRRETGRHSNDARAAAEPRKQEAGEREMPQVVDAEMRLEPVGRLSPRPARDARVVDQDVQLCVPLAEPGREPPH